MNAPFTPAPPAQRTSLAPPERVRNRVLVLRTPSGISGDMLVSGLARLGDVTDEGLEAIVHSLGVPELHGALRVQPHSLQEISGWKAQVQLPAEQTHRTLADVVSLIDRSAMAPPAAQLATRSFEILAQAEARVHGIAMNQVHFHEVGALDSILDTCLAAALFQLLAPARFVCSPLPVCDGVIRCAHGLMASPAPAVLEMLSDVPVYGIPSQGETVTPTALAFLKAAGAIFGSWPRLTVERSIRAFGGRVLPGVPNGAIFVLGTETSTTT